MALKSDLRTMYLAKRRQLTEAEAESASQKIAELFFKNFAPKSAQTIHTFLPIQKNREVNTWLIIQELRTNYPQVQIAVPLANPVDFSMAHYLLQSDTELVLNAWGIPEPVNALPIPESEINMVLLPLLVADAQGHRVGYGKGFYDRFLALLPKTSLKLGLAFDEPVELIDDITEFDLILDALITPEQVHVFKSESSSEQE